MTRVALPSESVTPVPLLGEAFLGSASTEVRAPYDGALLGRVPVCGAEEVAAAVAASRAAMADHPLPPWERAAILDRAAALLRERQEEFAQIIAREAAKPIKTARVEADRAAGTFTFAALEARRLVGEVIPLEAAPGADGKVAFTLRVPVGVVGAISPFNFPLNLVAHKLAPAIAAGCAVVLKPAGQTPYSALALAWLLLEECGLPAGYLHVVTGSGSVVGNALVEHPDVSLLTFTGSPEVGWAIRAQAPRKRVGLQLATTPPWSSRPTATGARPPTRSRSRASRTPGSRASRPSGSTSTETSPRSSPTTSAASSARSSWATRWTRPPTCRS